MGIFVCPGFQMQDGALSVAYAVEGVGILTVCYLDHRVLVLLSNALLPLLKRHQFCSDYPVLSNPTGNGHNNSICVLLDDCDFWDFIDANLNALAIERVLSPLCKTDGDCTSTYILTITHRMLVSPQVQARAKIC
uniref:F-box domain-containing protein n=1 Tax=Globodera rostochiensis TaxID=31243 RepID=A0A914HKG7_GLORO